MTTRELLIKERDDFNQGTRVINCVLHASIPLSERSDTCRLCMTDVKNQLRLVIRVNEFLNDLFDRAVEVTPNA